MLVHIELLKITSTENLFVELRNVNGSIKGRCVSGDTFFDFVLSKYDARYLANKLIEWSNDKMEDINE